jgi:hypothetical protein
LRLVAEFLQHAFEQAALHRIVVDNEDRHRTPDLGQQRGIVPFRGTVEARA